MSVQGQASNKAMDCDLLRKKLAAGESTVASLQSEVLERKQETDELRKKLKNAETTAQEQQQTAAEEVRLQRMHHGNCTLSGSAYLQGMLRFAHQLQYPGSDSYMLLLDCLFVCVFVPQLHSVQRELLDAKELLTSQSFEAQQMQRRLEEMVQRLSDRNAALDAHKEVGHYFSASRVEYSAMWSPFRSTVVGSCIHVGGYFV